jgi:hypothetical protein
LGYNKCPISGEIRRLVMRESCRRLAAAFGQDAVSVLRGEMMQKAIPSKEPSVVVDEGQEAVNSSKTSGDSVHVHKTG